MVLFKKNDVRGGMHEPDVYEVYDLGTTQCVSFTYIVYAATLLRRTWTAIVTTSQL